MKILMSFFPDLVYLTPIQHLLKYGWFWLLFILFCFGILILLNRKT